MKRVIKLTEQDLHRIIKESVDKCLTELDWRTFQSAKRKMDVKSYNSSLSKPEVALYKRRSDKLNNAMNNALKDKYDITMDDYDKTMVDQNYDDLSDKQLRGVAAIGRNKRAGDKYVSGVGYQNK